MESRRTITLLTTAVLVALLALAVSGCGDDGPAQTVEAFIYAAVEQDCPAMVDLLSESSRTALGATRDEAVSTCEAQLLEATSGAVKTEVTRFEVTGVDVDGNEATVDFSMAVRVTGQTEDVPRDDSLRTRKEDGQWKVDTS